MNILGEEAEKSLLAQNAIPARIAINEVLQTGPSAEGEDGPVEDGPSPEATPFQGIRFMTQTAPSNGAGAGAAATGKGGLAAPMIRTMVEALPGNEPHGDGGQDSMGDFLPESLNDVFDAKEYGDPRVKALLRGRDPVDLKGLAKELDEFTKTVLARDGSI